MRSTKLNEHGTSKGEFGYKNLSKSFEKCLQ